MLRSMPKAQSESGAKTVIQCVERSKAPALINLHRAVRAFELKYTCLWAVLVCQSAPSMVAMAAARYGIYERGVGVRILGPGACLATYPLDFRYSRKGPSTMSPSSHRHATTERGNVFLLFDSTCAQCSHGLRVARIAARLKNLIEQEKQGSCALLFVSCSAAAAFSSESGGRKRYSCT